MELEHRLGQIRWLELQMNKRVKLRISLSLEVRLEAGVIAKMHVQLI